MRRRSAERPKIFKGPASHFVDAYTEIHEISFPPCFADPVTGRPEREYAGALIRLRRLNDGTARIEIYSATEDIRVSAPDSAIGAQPAPAAALDTACVNMIADLLSGQEWSSDTCADIASLVRERGRTIDDVETE
jgi:hypothetical protein